MGKGNMTGKKSVLILPESDERTICVQFDGPVNREDHEKYLTGEVAKRADKLGSFNLVIIYNDDHLFQDYQAAEANIRGLMSFAARCTRAAYVNPTQRKMLQIKLLEPLFAGEVRFFNAEERDEAIAWAKQGRPALRS